MSKKSLADFKKIQDVFATSRNYKSYRDILAASTPPLVPHIGLVPKDLFAIEETNSTFVATTGSQLVNWDKMRLLHSTLSRIHRWQHIHYKNLQPDDHILNYLKQVAPVG